MKAFTAEELRGKASDLRKVISRESQALLTASAIRQARAQLALKSIRERARKTGRNRMTIAQIDRVIAATRKARHRRGSGQEKRRP